MSLVPKRTLTPIVQTCLIVLLLFCAAPSHAQFSFFDLYDFFNCSGGQACGPLNLGELAQGADGNLYGTTTAGGLHAFGTIFMVTPSGTYTDLWDFDGVTGENPYGALILASDGNFYGTAFGGGSFNDGTVFRFTPPSTVTVLHSFNGSDGLNPVVPPTQGKDGNLYGVTFYGNTYSIVLPAGTFKPLPQITPTAVYAPLYLASDGNLYGTTSYGGTNNLGTVYRMSTPGGAVTVIHNFNTSDGASPGGPVTQGSDGFLYGTTDNGGVNAIGEVFKMSGNGKIVSTFGFDAFSGSTNVDGGFPNVGLWPGADGYLYGTTQLGGADAFGTVFRVSTSLAFTKLFDFNGMFGPNPGSYPETGLVQHTNGNFYGLTEFGGAASEGNFYALNPFNLTQILKVEGPIFVKPGTPVQLLGNNLSQVFQLTFGSVSAHRHRSSLRAARNRGHNHGRRAQPRRQSRLRRSTSNQLHCSKSNSDSSHSSNRSQDRKSRSSHTKRHGRKHAKVHSELIDKQTTSQRCPISRAVYARAVEGSLSPQQCHSQFELEHTVL